VRYRYGLFTLFFLLTCSFSLNASDQLLRLAKLTESDGTVGNDILGNSVAMDGDTIVVGDVNSNVGQNFEEGAAYVFVKPANGWHDMTQTAKLTASDGEESDHFAQSVSIRGDTIAIGSYCHPQQKQSLRCPGTVYLFVKPAGGWKDMTETAQLSASDDHVSSGFYLGWSVALDGSGGTVFGDAIAWPSDGCAKGKIYVFVKPATGWKNMTQNAELTASDGRCFNIMGATLSSSGDDVAAWAPGWPNGAGTNCCQGASYIFAKPAGGWKNMTQTARLTALDSVPGDEFGFVSLDGGTLVAGSQLATVDGHFRQGAAYIFLEPKTGWKNTSHFQAKVTAFNGQTKDTFGFVSLSGNHLLVGADGYASDEGAAYFYNEPSSGWKSTSKYDAKLTEPAHQPAAFFGYSVFLQGKVMVVGAYLEKPTGAAYVYEQK
jgi:hypothetical protein